MGLTTYGSISINGCNMTNSNTTYTMCQPLNSCGTSINSLYNNTASEINTLSEYIDYMNRILGIDMTFEKFKDLDESERQQFLRNEKLKRLI